MKGRLRIAGFAGASFIRALGHTWRVRITDEKYVDESAKLAPATLFAFWHGRMLPLAYHYRDRLRKAYVLASAHRDGELMGQTIRFLGFGHFRGSSTRGDRNLTNACGKFLTPNSRNLTIYTC